MWVRFMLDGSLCVEPTVSIVWGPDKARTFAYLFGVDDKADAPRLALAELKSPIRSSGRQEFRAYGTHCADCYWLNSRTKTDTRLD